jgi:hypothetical protein
MRKKMILMAILCMDFAVLSVSTAARTTPSKTEATDTLGMFLGHWRTTGEMKETPYSKARRKSDDEMTCQWMPNRGFLICDQLIHRPQGIGNELSIYTYNEKDHNYAFFGIGREDKEARTTKLTIQDNVWTYADEADEAGRHVQFRTLNTFISPKEVTWRSEYSEDGAHWILMGEGKDMRIP